MGPLAVMAVIAVEREAGPRMYIPQGAVAFFTDLGGRTTVVSLKHSGPNQRSFSLRASIFPLSRVRAHLAFPF